MHTISCRPRERDVTLRRVSFPRIPKDSRAYLKSEKYTWKNYQRGKLSAISPSFLRYCNPLSLSLSFESHSDEVTFELHQTRSKKYKRVYTSVAPDAHKTIALKAHRQVESFLAVASTTVRIK